MFKKLFNYSCLGRHSRRLDNVEIKVSTAKNCPSGSTSSNRHWTARNSTSGSGSLRPETMDNTHQTHLWLSVVFFEFRLQVLLLTFFVLVFWLDSRNISKSRAQPLINKSAVSVSVYFSFVTVPKTCFFRNLISNWLAFSTMINVLSRPLASSKSKTISLTFLICKCSASQWICIRSPFLSRVFNLIFNFKTRDERPLSVILLPIKMSSEQNWETKSLTFLGNWATSVSVISA